MIKLDEMTQMDFNSLMIGDYIGSGVSRDVYHFPLLPYTVIKIEKQNKETTYHSFQNVIEWSISSEMSFTKEINCLAKALYISPCGKILIQEYAKDLEDADIEKAMKMRVPNFLTDAKIENLGKTIDDRIVFRDYGTSIITSNYRLRSLSKDLKGK